MRGRSNGTAVGNLRSAVLRIDRLMHSHGYEKRFADYAVIDGWYRKAC